MFCREANEAHIALLSTLPPHMAQQHALLGIPLLHPENDPQQIQNEKMIREFKTLPCGLEGNMTSHDHRCCPFFHSERDRRRVVLAEGSQSLYNAEPCNQQFDDQRVCSHGEGCGLCHSTAELLYHPDFFRKRLCHQAKRCPRGRFCAFAHSRQELLVPHFSEMEETEPTEDFIAWRFKTQWCPIGGPHDWENCVYAHTYRDWRRVPTLGYTSRPCPHWVQSVTTGPAELSYADRCPRGMACPLAHGAKEQLYHPQFYKTSPCSEANCKRHALCAFTHGPHDIRRPRGDEQLPSSVRDPILQAVELLGRNQPTFWSPPRYHALEDPPGNTAGKGHKGRSRGGSMSSLPASKQQDRSMCWSDGSPHNVGMDSTLLGNDMSHPHALPYCAGGGSHGSMGDHVFSAFGMPAQYPMCQWVPMGCESQCAGSQLIPPGMGYGSMNEQVMESPWNMLAGYSPWVCGPYMQQPGMLAQQNGMQPGLQPGSSPFLMTVPASPQRSEQANQVLEELTMTSPARQDGKPSLGGSPMSLTTDNFNFGMDPAEAFSADLTRALTLGGMPSWPSMSEEELLARQHNHFLRKGLRTPSSLGSPPMSETPTEVPSPRHIEGNSNGSERSSEGLEREPHALEALPQVFLVSPMKEIPYAKSPKVESVRDPLALQYFTEAPPPASPARV